MLEGAKRWTASRFCAALRSANPSRLATNLGFNIVGLGMLRRLTMRSNSSIVSRFHLLPLRHPLSWAIRREDGTFGRPKMVKLFETWSNHQSGDVSHAFQRNGRPLHLLQKPLHRSTTPAKERNELRPSYDLMAEARQVQSGVRSFQRLESSWIMKVVSSSQTDGSPQRILFPI